MAVAKRQGRSKEGLRTRVRTTGRTALLTKPNLQRASPGGRKKHIKRGAKGLSLPLSRSLMPMLSLSLSITPHPPNPHTPHAGALLYSLLFFKDGFSCYLLNKIEL